MRISEISKYVSVDTLEDWRETDVPTLLQLGPAVGDLAEVAFHYLPFFSLYNCTGQLWAEQMSAQFLYPSHRAFHGTYITKTCLE